MTETDLAGAVTDDDQSGETKAAATLHDLGDTIDVHQLVDQVAVLFLAATTVTTTAAALAASTTFAATVTTAAAATGFGRLLFVVLCHIRVP
jgi:hypothetical protein